MSDHRQRFMELMTLGDNDFDLAEAALLISAELNPSLEIHSVLSRLDQMANDAQVFQPVRPTARESLGGLNRYLFEHFGLVGNQIEYYDPRNSFLNDVLDRRMGIPITISVIYLEIGWRLGLPLYGIGMPGHFLIGCRDDDNAIILDAFNGGRECSIDECAAMIARIYGGALPFHRDMLTPATRREIVIRMLGNLRVISGQARQHDVSLRWSDLNVIASQGTARSIRERGAVRLAGGDRAGARKDLTEAMNIADSDDERRESELLIQHLDATEKRQ